MGLQNPQGYFNVYGASSTGGAGPNILIPQTRIPRSQIPGDLGNRVNIRDIVLSAARGTQDTKVIVEIADDNGSGAPGTWREVSSIRTADYGNAMRSHLAGVMINQGQWYRARSTQVLAGAHEIQLNGETAVNDITASYLNGAAV